MAIEVISFVLFALQCWVLCDTLRIMGKQWRHLGHVEAHHKWMLVAALAACVEGWLPYPEKILAIILVVVGITGVIGAWRVKARREGEIAAQPDDSTGRDA